MSSAFEWTDERNRAAVALAEGRTQQDIAEELGITDRAIRKWLSNQEFAEEVDRLSLMIGVASRAERLRLANRVIRQRISGTSVDTDKDLLDWLKFAQSETDGIKLDLSKLAAITEDAPSVADSGPNRANNLPASTETSG